MRPAWRFASCILSLAAQGTAFAQSRDDEIMRPGIGIDLRVSTDADKTDVIKLAGRALIDYKGPDEYRGIVLERDWFTPYGQVTRKDVRGYLDIADRLGDWRWKVRVGTDGRTILGSATFRKKDWSQEFFVEREVVETPIGLDNGIYSTFVGTNFDIPVDDRNNFSAMAGLQAFTGENKRIHLRASYIHVLNPAWGLSAQLRARYYHSTAPGEFDYFSPRDFVQVMPLLQLRRFHRGWEYKLQAAYGAQRASGFAWHDSRYANLRVISPARADDWELRAEVTYSNTSVTSGLDYDYLTVSLGAVRAF